MDADFGHFAVSWEVAQAADDLGENLRNDPENWCTDEKGLADPPLSHEHLVS